jgi:hypothetical protein
MNAIGKTILFLLLAFATFAQQSHAHFVFVYGEDGKVKIVFGESTDPDQAQFLGGLSSMKAYTIIDGEKKEVQFEKVVEGDDGWFEASQDGVGSLLNVTCPYGVFGRGDKSMYLDYSAKFVRFPLDSESAKPSKDLKLDLVPSFENGQLKVITHFKGMPLNDAEVKLELIEYSSFETTTDDTGAAVLAAPTRYVVRAKHTVAEAGEIDGKSFSEKRYYCTMVLDLGGEAAKGSSAATAKPAGHSNDSVTLKELDRGYEDFPHGMTSFGATVLNGKIYVTGGKAGRAHHYARSYQNGEIWCLDLADKQWETVGDTLGLQGLAIVAHDGKIIRIGGLEARNEEGEEHALQSLADVKAFDPETKKWSTLPSLPHGRSSFDACVHDNKIFVAGGWTMAIGEESEWAEDMLVLDLSSEKPEWQSIEVPFMTRAVAVRAFANKIFVLGGIEDGGGPTEAVHVFDFENEEWSSGPDIPCESGMKAFGCSAATVSGHLLVSTYDGGIYRLSDDKSDWEIVHQLESGRFFHQMLPAGKSSFAIVGGAHMKNGSQTEIAVFEVSPAKSADEAKVSVNSKR